MKKQTPHYCIKNNLRRDGKTVSDGKGDPQTFSSLRKAKRYMRTGKEVR